MYLLIRQIVFQTYGRWSGWNGRYLSRLWYVFTYTTNYLPNLWKMIRMKWMIFKSLMICIYLDDKLSSKLMEDDQDEMDDI